MTTVIDLKQATALQKIQVNFSFFKKDIVFTIAFSLALFSSALHMPKLEYINLRVLISLFNLMIAVKAFEQLRLLDRLGVAILNRCSNSRRVSAVLISLTFFSAMFVTNDVSLITFVPLTLIIGKKAEIAKTETVILQTIAANIGSSLTPMGNPQNLFIFSYYHLKTVEFILTVGLFALLGIGLLAIFIFRMERREITIHFKKYSFEDRRQAVIWGIVFAIIIASIVGGISYYWAFAVVLLTVLLCNRSLLLKIDYVLLLTFICFFIFIGNLSHFELIHSLAARILNGSASVYFSSILSSQVISNVPASILLAKFTNDWRPLLLGVNIGGLGTLVASLASLISYKLFSRQNPEETKDYLFKFSFYNFGFLIVLSLVQYLLF